MSDWQPIETAPIWQHVLVYDHAGAEVLEAYQHVDGGGRRWCRANLGPDDEDSLVMEPRFWMPLPDPPKEAA